MKKIVKCYFQIVLLVVSILLEFLGPLAAPVILVLLFKQSPLWFLLLILYIFTLPALFIEILYLEGEYI